MAYETIRHELARGQILKILAPEHPNPVDFTLLRRLLDTFGFTVRDETLISYCAYLQERGYLKMEVRKTSVGVLRFAMITATGLDLLDGRKDDDGVEVGF